MTDILTTQVRHSPEHKPDSRVLHTAIGVLVGWRRCSTNAAFRELVSVSERHRVGIFALATALVSLASQDDNPSRGTAAELAAAYARRWAVETCFAELKARLRGPGRVLRSRTPGLALQEIWAYLAVYQAVRALIARTAAGHGLDPARLSFTAALASAEAALLAAPVPERPGRVRPRAVREPGPAYPSAKAQDPLPRHATYTVTINPAPAPPRNQPSQHKPAESQAEPPP